MNFFLYFSYQIVNFYILKIFVSCILVSNFVSCYKALVIILIASVCIVHSESRSDLPNPYTVLP